MSPLDALRFRWNGEEAFQAPPRAGVPLLVALERLLQATERILRDEETDEESNGFRPFADVEPEWPDTQPFSRKTHHTSFLPSNSEIQG
jgi:hypothetical protein